MLRVLNLKPLKGVGFFHAILTIFLVMENHCSWMSFIGHFNSHTRFPAFPVLLTHPHGTPQFSVRKSHILMFPALAKSSSWERSTLSWDGQTLISASHSLGHYHWAIKWAPELLSCWWPPVASGAGHSSSAILCHGIAEVEKHLWSLSSPAQAGTGCPAGFWIPRSGDYINCGQPIPVT